MIQLESFHSITISANLRRLHFYRTRVKILTLDSLEMLMFGRNFEVDA